MVADEVFQDIGQVQGDQVMEEQIVIVDSEGKRFRKHKWWNKGIRKYKWESQRI